MKNQPRISCYTVADNSVARRGDLLAKRDMK
jgi:hypothetical protein